MLLISRGAAQGSDLAWKEEHRLRCLTAKGAVWERAPGMRQ